MTEQTDPAEDARAQEDDHDLLTFLESGIRLREEIEQVRAEAEATDDEATRTRLLDRLGKLEEASARNSQTAAEKPGEAGFLTYDPSAGR